MTRSIAEESSCGITRPEGNYLNRGHNLFVLQNSNVATRLPAQNL